MADKSQKSVFRPEEPGDQRPLAARPRKGGRPPTKYLRKILENALTVTPEEVDTFVWDNVDVTIAESILGGARTREKIADDIGISPQALRYRLKSPARCAWISQQLCRVVPQRLGQIYAAMYDKAIHGDVRAANLILERFDPMFRPATGTQNLTQINVGRVDIRKLSEGELGARIQEKFAALRSRGVTLPLGGTGAEAEFESAEILEAVPEAEEGSVGHGEDHPVDCGQSGGQDNGGMDVGDS